ncbi:MAG: type I glyceraldehyde-3-phosphate dehydrogenase [Chitinophagaceae bacterium]|nr:MAG: type I glyceraldehyde-3-phosphate dehydrogenase [Chitinophagaceae bacterium]
MKKVRIAINGFGRIGRLTTNYINKVFANELEVVAVNDLTDNKTLAHLLKYDSAHGVQDFEISYDDKKITAGKNEILVFSEKDPENLPWGDLDIDIVLECTGKFRKADVLSKHIKAGAKKVILSAPSKDNSVKSFVLGVNDSEITAGDTIISNASCTTNCLAPMAKILNENWGIEEGFMTTVHAYTGDQNLQDGPHKDLRRARAAAQNIVPTTTGAAQAVELVIPELKGKLSGFAARVPVIDGSLTDFTCLLKKHATKEEINLTFKRAAESNLKGLLEYTEEPLVSSDIIGNNHSCIFDSSLTDVRTKLVKVIGWYDNEQGYAARMADMCICLKKYI